MATDVLIIEDEPVIAADIEDLVKELGHTRRRHRATRTEAVDAVASEQPGLVLADIQLADGSSGHRCGEGHPGALRRAGDLHHRLSPSAC